MADDTQLERMLPLMRAREEGERTAAIVNVLGVLEPLLAATATAKRGEPINLDLGAGLRDLVRRFGGDDVLGAARFHPHARKVILAIVEEIATAETVPIDLATLDPKPAPKAEPEPAPNGPTDVGGRDMPGGWTGLRPDSEKPTPSRRRVRREDQT